MTFVTHTAKQCSHPLLKLQSIVIDMGNVQHAGVEAIIQREAKVLITLLDAGIQGSCKTLAFSLCRSDV